MEVADGVSSEPLGLLTAHYGGGMVNGVLSKPLSGCY